MLFGNVFSGLTKVAKSVAGLIKGEQIEPVTFHEHDLHPLAPTVEPLLVESEAVEEWRDYQWKYSDKCKVQVSSFGHVRIQHLNSDDVIEWRPVNVNWCDKTKAVRGILYSKKLIGGPKSSQIRLDIAMLETFVGRPVHLTQKMLPVRVIVYLDGNEKNCKLDNLRWVTPKELSERLGCLVSTLQEQRKTKARELKAVSAKSIEQELAAKRAKKEEAEKQRVEKIEQDIENEVDRQFDAEFDEFLDSLTTEQETKQASDERRADKVLSGVEKIEIKAEDKRMPVEDIQPKFDGNIDFQKALREEIWLPIPTYEGAYEVSSFGNVRSIGRFVTRHRIVKVKNGTEEERRPYQYYQNGKRLKPSMMDGALEISLSKGGKQSRLSIAKLVLVVFAKDKLSSANFNVIHLNGNLNNCRLNNLLIADVVEAA
ncbi:NUMOD4 domain-containing protein [Acinetobacter tibetensis]|uniref:NUMOD4 domain-containing protein n=1 Tax=Acinetobacter tibetensis TaxID=2943497 RepID=UPI003A4DE1DD